MTAQCEAVRLCCQAKSLEPGPKGPQHRTVMVVARIREVAHYQGELVTGQSMIRQAMMILRLMMIACRMMMMPTDHR